jgi:hypothetical protein
VLRDCPVAFIWACMASLADATMDAMAREPQAADAYRQMGFEILWNGIAQAK